jgi:acyl-CoA thioesterase YciA
MNCVATPIKISLGRVYKIGRSSMTVKIRAFAHRGRTGEKIEVTDGLFTYVAVDSEGKPRPVVEPSSEK